MAFWKPTRKARQQWRELNRNGFGTGLVTRARKHCIPENALADAQNIMFDGDMAVKRKGYNNRFGSNFDADDPCNGIGAFYLADGTTRLVFGASTVLYYDSPHLITTYDSQANWDTGTLSAVDSATSAGDIQLYATPTNISQVGASGAVYYSYGANYNAQTFTPDSYGEISSVELKMFKEGTPPDLIVEIRSTSAGQPTSTVLATETIAVASVGTVTDWVVITLSSPLDVSSGTVYAVVAYATGDGGDASNRYGINSAGSSLYAGGLLYTSANSGSSWSADATQDLAFKVNFARGNGNWLSPWVDVSSATDTGSGNVATTTTTPANTSVTVETRSNSTGSASGATAWAAVSPDGTINSAYNDYIQIRISLVTTSTGTPVASKSVLSYDGTPSATSLQTGMASNVNYHFETWTGLLIITNGSDTVKKWDATTFAALGGSPPTVKYLRLVPGTEYLFLAGNATYPSRLYYSNLGTPETWGANDYIDIGEDDGDIITALAVLGESLVIFKQWGIYRLFGKVANDFTVKPVVKGIGCIASKSVAHVEGLLYFLSRDGVRVFDGSPQTAFISETIRPTLDAYNFSQWTKAAGVGWRGNYLLAIAGASSTYNNRVLCWDAIYKRWSYFTGWNISDWVIYRQYSEDTLIGASATVGQLYECFEGYNDGGSAIMSILETRHEDMGSMRNVKDLDKVAVFLEGQTNQNTITANVIHDNTTASNQTITLSAGDGTMRRNEVKPHEASVYRARLAGLKLTHSTVDEEFGCSGYSWYYREGREND